jgi:hypothetical protein
VSGSVIINTPYGFGLRRACGDCRPTGNHEKGTILKMLTT